MFGGLCAFTLAYFGTDQSQVQRYLSSASLRESRLGLMFNAICKIPMQFLILLLGVLLFVFYQFETPPVYFNQTAWKAAAAREPGKFDAVEQKFKVAHTQREQSIHAWLAARHHGDKTAAMTARAQALAANEQSEAARVEAREALRAADPTAQTNDGDYVFITFILAHLPHGVIGLLVAAFFAAALSSKAAELSALGSTTSVDFYRLLLKREAREEHYIKASKWFTAMWGFVALGFALFARLQENLIQAVNIIGSVFYGVVLALFLVAFFVKWVRGTAVFIAALTAQALVIILYHELNISYLWYWPDRLRRAVLFSILLQALLGQPSAAGGGANARMLLKKTGFQGQRLLNVGGKLALEAIKLLQISHRLGGGYPSVATVPVAVFKSGKQSNPPPAGQRLPARHRATTIATRPTHHPAGGDIPASTAPCSQFVLQFFAHFRVPDRHAFQRGTGREGFFDALFFDLQFFHHQPQRN